MAKNFKYKFNLNKLTNIEIYELVLQGELPTFPSGFWASADNKQAKEIAMKLLHYLIDQKLGLCNEEINMTVSKKFSTRYKLYTASKYFGRSAVKYVMSAYPDMIYPWELMNSEVPNGTWEDKNNRILAIKEAFENEV